MKKRIIFCLLIIVLLGSFTGCGDLDPAKVTKNYVQNRFEGSLRRNYGTEFKVNIISFDENSENREAKAVAYPKKDPSLSFEMTGSIGDDYFFSDSRIGSSYHVRYDFNKVLFSKIDKELGGKYSFEIGGNADYEQIASNIRDYMKQLRILLDDYKTGYYLKIYFEEKYKRADIPLTLNGEEVEEKFSDIIIDERNGKVVVDTCQGDNGWLGQLEIEEYIELLAKGQLKKKINEIRLGYDADPIYDIDE